MNCPNPAELFGKKYVVGFEPAHKPRRGRQPDPWLMQIEARYGMIYPHGPDTLAVDIDYHNKLARTVLTLKGTRLVQDGDFEKTICFPIAAFAAVARIVKPRRLRKPSRNRKR